LAESLPLATRSQGRHVPTLPVRWQPGEHVAIIGDTGTGKTFLMSKLVQMRKYVVFLRTKPDDNQFPNFEKFRKAEGMDQWDANRILLEPHLSYQAKEIWLAINKVWKHGSWTLVVDEMWYAERRLGLREPIENLLTQGRSKKITVMVGMQRPAWVSRFGIAEATHVFAFRTEGRDTKALADSTTPKIAAALESLEGHDFVYFNRAKRLISTGNALDISGIFNNRSENA
jgi:hypothetical protein